MALVTTPDVVRCRQQIPSRHLRHTGAAPVDRVHTAFVTFTPIPMETPAYVLQFEKPLRELVRQLDELRQRSIETTVDVSNEIRVIERNLERMQREIYANLSPWQKVQIARHPKRPYALDYIGIFCEDF